MQLIVKEKGAKASRRDAYGLPKDKARLVGMQNALVFSPHSTIAARHGF